MGMPTADTVTHSYYLINGHQLKSKQIQGTYLFRGSSMGGVENLSSLGFLVNYCSTLQIAEKTIESLTQHRRLAQ